MTDLITNISGVVNTATGTILTNGSTAIGAAVINIDGLSGSTYPALNSLFKIGTTTYQVQSYTGTSPTLAITCIPPVAAIIADNTAVNFATAVDYTSVQSWETTTSSAITTGNRVIGEIWGGAALDASVGSFQGATGTFSRTTRRILRTGYGQQYDPATRLGAYLKLTTTMAGTQIWQISEAYFWLDKVALLHDFTTETGTRYPINVLADNVDITKCCVVLSATPTTPAIVGAGIKYDSTVVGGWCYNNIVIGRDLAMLGTFHGIEIAGPSSVSLGKACINNTVRGFVTSSASSRALYVHDLFSASWVFNNLLFDSSGLNLDSTNNAIKNFTGDTSGYSSAATNQANLYSSLSSEVFSNPDYDNLRLRYGSRAVDTGYQIVAGGLYGLPFTLADDYFSKSRIGIFDIGAIDGAVIPAWYAPTTVINSIGAGKDYATIALWEAATRLHLVYTNKVYIGEVYDNFDIAGTNIVISGAVADSTRYRALRPATGLAYDPTISAGIAIRGNASTGGVITIDEPFFQLNGVKVEQYYSATTSSRACVQVTRSGVKIDSCVATGTVGTTVGYIAGFYATNASYITCTNCLAIGEGATVGLTNGFYEGVSANSNLFANCIAYKILGYGFRLTSTASSFIKNSIGTDCTNAFYNTGMEPYLQACISSDTTAVGVKKQISKTAASLFTNPTAGDFTLKITSPAINAGYSLQTVFTNDFTGATRSSPWECGIYNGFPAGITGAKVNRLSLMRYATCWKIERKDGFALYVTDHNTSLILQGQTYLPTGGFDSSVVRRELGMKADDTEYSGVISSTAITHEYLRGGRYNLAKVTEYVVDWKYPWAKPQITANYYIKTVEYDGETWKATVAGMSYLLQQPAGRTYNRQCDATLFDGRCKVAKAGFTIANKSVTGVSSSGSFRIAFLTSTIADSAYKYGMLVWRTGANTGIECEVRSNDATTLVTLQQQVPYTIVNGDTFDISQGCAHTQSVCLSKFGNIVNYRGYREVPGTDRQLQTPVR